jgi:hypothetical protein
MTSPAAYLKRFTSILNHLPAVQHAFAYGSGAFHQPGLYGASTNDSLQTSQEYKNTAVISHEDASSISQATTAKNSTKPMIDFILAVDDPLAWHKEVIRLLSQIIIHKDKCCHAL